VSELGGRPLRWRPALITLGILLVIATAINLLAYAIGLDDPEWLPTVIVGAMAGLLVTPLYTRIFDRIGEPRQ